MAASETACASPLPAPSEAAVGPADPMRQLWPVGVGSPPSPQFYVEALDQIAAVVIMNARGTIVYVNERFERMSGFARSEVIGRNHRALSSDYHPPSFFNEMYRTVTAGERWRGEIKCSSRDGGTYWVDTTIVPLTAEDDTITGYFSARIDITARKAAEEALLRQTETLQVILDKFPGGISLFDADLRMVLCNEQQKELLDYSDELFADGDPTLEELFRFNAQRGEYGPGDIEAHVATRLDRVRQQRIHAYERERPNGTVLEVRGVPLDGGGFVTTYLDVTERRRAQSMVAHMAHHDALTGLANRLLLREHVENALARVKRGEVAAIHYLDLDRFKPVNDGFGHQVGDELLKAVADRLRLCTRDTDTVARFGGDEFAILQVGLARPQDAQRLADRIIASLAEPYRIGGHDILIGASIGIAVAPYDGDSMDVLVKEADAALYRAKARGRGGFCFSGGEAEMRG